MRFFTYRQLLLPDCHSNFLYYLEAQDKKHFNFLPSTPTREHTIGGTIGVGVVINIRDYNYKGYYS